MEDISKIPCAEWLEETLRYILASNPSSIGICIIEQSGEGATAYWGTNGPQDKCLMASHINADAMLEMVLCNVDKIADAIEELGDEE